ncbi:MAG TPA: hypothetical protein VGA40_10835 [Candidatus Acidoferrales bacterium]
MARDLSSDEVRAEHLHKLGPELGAVYHELSEDFSWLVVKWGQYQKLFGTSPKRIDLLNSAASFFFYMVETTLWEDVLLHLSRLTDRVQVMGKRTLTIQSLPKLCSDQALRDQLTKLVDHAIAATGFARDWRNRQIAHRDLDLALKGNVQPFEAASRARVKEAVKAIHAVMNKISEHCLGSQLDEDVIEPLSDGENLLYVIRDGVEAKAARMERLEKGCPTPEDLRHRPID